MKRFLASSVMVMVFALSACSNKEVKTVVVETQTTGQRQVDTTNIHNPEEQVDDWQVALQYLKAGNQRFVSNQTMGRDSNQEDREILVGGQSPFAVVITCADSRVSPESYFDQKLGDIFVIRNAGNIADETVLGSVEYAVEHLKAPLVVVVGHSHCGAVTGALADGEHPENLQTILNTISVAVEGSGNLNEAIEANIRSVVAQVKADEIMEEAGANVIGAYYDIESGVVSWLE